MATLIHPLKQWPLLQHHFLSQPAFHHIISSSSLLSSSKATTHSLAFSTVSSSNRNIHHYPPLGLRLADASTPFYLKEEGNSTDSDSDSKKSRNQKKREAKRAVRWGMELASFSLSQIKRILRVASIEREVYEALMLVKRLGSDVREGKRRQYNYIGKLLREVRPELMDAMILATKDGDWCRVQAVPGLEMGIIDDDKGESEETESEDEEGSSEYITRWLDGLINKDIELTNEVYAVHSVDFDVRNYGNLFGEFIRFKNVLSLRKKGKKQKQKQKLQ